MHEPKTCPTCGAALASDATGGACPKCLLEAGFATGGASGGAVAGAPAGGDRIPTVEELGPKFPGLEIEALVGRGGMGVVFRARHKALDRVVALKVLSASVAADRAFADRFQREARALAKLQHPNIVAVHDFGVTDGLFWLVMEYVEGANIRQAMRAGQIRAKEALAIVPQICDALQYAHEHGVVHRDIKPENILLDTSGRVKIADFGLAKLMERGTAEQTLTGAGQVMGTLHYMAPEQWERPKHVDHRADIYSLGVVFYEMLTGELPVGRFAAPSAKSDVDVRIDEIVLRTLEREREARYQHAAEVKTDVGRLSAGGPPASGAGTRDPSLQLSAEVRPWRSDRATAAVLGLWTLAFGAAAWVVWDAEPVMLALPAAGLILVGWDGVRRLRPRAEGATVGAGSAVPTPVLAALALLFCGIALWALATLRIQFDRSVVAGALLGAAVKLYLLVRARMREPRPVRPRLPPWVLVLIAVVGLGAVVAVALRQVLLDAADRSAVAALERDVELARAAAASAASARDFEAVSERGALRQIPDDERERIAVLWQRALRLAADAPFASVVELYVYSGQGTLNAMSEEERHTLPRQGRLGLPLTPAAALPQPLAHFKLTRVEFHGSGAMCTSAVAVATDGVHSLRIPLGRSYIANASGGRLTEWYFSIGRVETIDAKLVPSTPAGNAVLRLYDRLRALGPQQNLFALGDLYTKTALTLLSSMPADEVARTGATGALGLPLMSEQSLGGKLADLQVEIVEFSADGASAAVSLRDWSQGHKGHFVGFRVARESDGTWRFTSHPAELR